MVAASKTFTFFALRNYQADMVAEIFEAFAQKERTVGQIATGAGKTAIGAAIADRFVKQKGRVLWLAHREELLLQAYEKLEEVCVAPVALIQSGKKIKPDALIQVASVQTVSRRSLPFDVDLIVTDEAHHAVSSTYLKVYEQFPQAYQLGLTATPKRLDGKGLDSVFDRLVSGISLSSLIEQKYLCPYRLFTAVTTIETKNVRTVAGDFNLKQLRVAAMSADVMGEIVPTWRRYAADRQTVVFCCDIEHSLAVCELYQNAGILAAHLDGDTPPTLRRKILADFADRTITVLVNCGIISEGLDIPGIECVQVLRPTQSLALDLQMVGRSLRPAPGKANAVILDHTKNWKTHGLPDADRVWSLDGAVKQEKCSAVVTADGEVVIEPERCVTHDSSPELIEITPQIIAEQQRAEDLEKQRYEQSGLQNTKIVPEQDQDSNAELCADPFLRVLKGGSKSAPSTPSPPSPYPWIDKLVRKQRSLSYKKGWVGYRVVDELRAIGHSDLEAFKYAGKLLGYHQNWAMSQWNTLQQELNDKNSNLKDEESLDLFSMNDEKLKRQQDLSDEPDSVSDQLLEIWQSVLAHVASPVTRMMMRQQCHLICHLIAYTGEQARIGITSQPLFRMAQERMPDIESAFALFCGRPIPLTLEVVAPGTQQINPQQTIELPPPTPPVNCPDLPASPPEMLLPPVRHDDVTKAAISLAQMFNGQVVNLEGDGNDDEIPF